MGTGAVVEVVVRVGHNGVVIVVGPLNTAGSASLGLDLRGAFEHFQGA